MSSFVVMDVALYLLVVLSVAGFSWEVAYGRRHKERVDSGSEYQDAFPEHQL